MKGCNACDRICCSYTHAHGQISEQIHRQLVAVLQCAEKLGTINCWHVRYDTVTIYQIAITLASQDGKMYCCNAKWSRQTANGDWKPVL